MLDARTTSGVHEAEVARLVQAYAALPPDAPVRLAKRTSNLFRFRDATAGATAELDVSAFGHVLSVDPVARTARVGGMTTYEDLLTWIMPVRSRRVISPVKRSASASISSSLISGNASPFSSSLAYGDARVTSSSEGRSGIRGRRGPRRRAPTAW